MVQADNHRETIKASLMAKAEDLFNNFDSFEVVVEEPEKNFIARRTWHEDTLPIVVSKYRV